MNYPSFKCIIIVFFNVNISNILRSVCNLDRQFLYKSYTKSNSKIVVLN